MRSKILFVVSDFYHGGAQREMYEIDRALKRENIEIVILCLLDLKSSRHFSDYFYEKHVALNTKIIFLKDIIKPYKKTIFNKLLNKLGLFSINSTNANVLTTFLKDYKEVFFMGEYTYKKIEHYILADYNRRKNIFIMSARFQGEHYRNINKNNKYNFISPFDTKEQIEYEFEGFTDYSHIHFPLSLSIDTSMNKWSFKNNQVKRIGIFTRLSKSKPLDPFFYAFHLLLKDMPDTELHVYGAGDYKEAEYDRYINHLDLHKNVFFRGHQKDIKQTLNADDIDLVWFQGYLNRPAGYAGQDVIITGTPILLWDFYLGENKNLNNMDYVYPHFKDLSSFALASKAVLQDQKLANQIAQKQFSDIVNTRDINKNIERIKHIFS
ncbi:hypothetical protein [Seonamhaeicola sp.]|uniref:glycosyltransferase n=1 Tax=Seonamhaeicola sp. TaxID=1912245 RepID=UPI0026194C13|nr:hypothetical protein [Seonamhaeicola sp.]